MFDQLSWLSADNKMLIRSGKMNKILTGSSTKCHLRHLDGHVGAIKQCRPNSDWSRTNSLISVYTVCHFCLHLLGTLLHCSNFRIIIAFFFGCPNVLDFYNKQPSDPHFVKDCSFMLVLNAIRHIWHSHTVRYDNVIKQDLFSQGSEWPIVDNIN